MVKKITSGRHETYSVFSGCLLDCFLRVLGSLWCLVIREDLEVLALVFVEIEARELGGHGSFFVA